MSLVDYASSSDEDEPQPPALEEPEREPLNPEERHRFGVPALPKHDLPHAHNRNFELQSSRQMEIVSDQSSELKLPDASLLLNSLAGPSNLLNASDHSSRVAVAMSENAARKRDFNGSRANNPRSSKVPKGTLPHSKNIPDTVAGRLLPPQLAGRSNVVTEDITKLFVRKKTNSSAE
ncbi:hypothetical protein ACJIZ3_016044 [Penstemon smallii]|uniref:Uncharacterized protein n=1 Tax=Penstemon smallii TaxID=265156 RepID=A0ABD3RS26_9LAMI